jgi:hypothetical protein
VGFLLIKTYRPSKVLDSHLESAIERRGLIMIYRTHLMRLAAALGLLAAGSGEAEVSIWKVGGSGLAWSDHDSVSVMIDFESAPRAIQPFYITPDRTVFSYLDNWTPWKIPRDKLGFVDGEQPRSWKGDEGSDQSTENGIYLVDGDSTTYNPGASTVWASFSFYTIDLAVPVPVFRFGFFTPSRGLRADGRPLRKDAVPSFEVSIAQEGDPSWLDTGAYLPVGTVIADVPENFATDVRLDFPKQYVRYIRYKRELSILDQELAEATGSEDSQQGYVELGTIGDFELFGEGVPRQALYKTRILDLGEELNFGRLFWSATPLRRIRGADVVDPGARVAVEVEVRTGRDGTPDVYHEYTDKALERVVSRERYERELRPPPYEWAGPQRGRPGMRASIGYDTDNWTYWSPPYTAPGQPLALKSGSHIQVRITLKSEEFDAFVRLDSLWIERAPLLAGQVLGEVARLDDPRPARGFTQVELGQMTDFVYALRADFPDAGAAGFNAVRVRTGTATRFRRLEMGTLPAAVEPVRVEEQEDGLLVVLPGRVTAADNPLIRLVFGAELFVLATTFEGQVLDTAVESLPQPIEAGDVEKEIATNSLRVLGQSGQTSSLVQELLFSSPILTPNGDGVNDRLELSYSLFRLPQKVAVRLEIYALDGRRVGTLPVGQQASGRQRVEWDGRSQTGELLPPGLYLMGIVLLSESTSIHQLRPVSIAY